MSKKQVEQLLQSHPALTHSVEVKVTSHVQREDADWLVNTLMIENVDVPFKFKRKQRYRNLKGMRVNLTYYPAEEDIAGMAFEYMKVVIIKVA